MCIYTCKCKSVNTKPIPPNYLRVVEFLNHVELQLLKPFEGNAFNKHWEVVGVFPDVYNAKEGKIKYLLENGGIVRE